LNFFVKNVTEKNQTIFDKYGHPQNGSHIMANVKGKTIQIYLPDGNPRGIKIADITSRTVQAILIPRSQMEEAAIRKELQNVGVYFLIGTQEEGGKPLLYVGEAEECFSRLKQHNKHKDFWTTAIAIVSKTQFFTKSHIKFLEWFSYETAKTVSRYQLDNGNIPSKPYISEPIEVDLKDNFETIAILVSTLGFPIFDTFKKAKKKEILICKGKDAFAEGEYTEDGLVVFEGSICNFEESKSASKWLTARRQKLIDSKVLLKKDNVYVFDSDYAFPSPSAAACAVLGRSANGWIVWKYKDGRTLDEVKRQK
jgi:hypothetical protein